MGFPKNIRRVRESAALTRNAACRALREAGVSVTQYALQAWEDGRNEPLARSFLALVRLSPDPELAMAADLLMETFWGDGGDVERESTTA